MKTTQTLTLVLLTLFVFFLASCSGGSQAQASEGSPFIGGQQGVTSTLEQGQPPAEVYDGGDQTFNIQVKLENKGEYTVPKDKVKVTVSGFVPESFKKTRADLTKNAPADLLSVRKLTNGNIQEGGAVFVDFPDLNYNGTVTGTQQAYPFRVETCYEYKTTARSNICVRKSILTPTANGVCEVGGDKQAYTSGGPLQIIDFKTSPRSQNTIQFAFTIDHKGSGTLHKLSSSCSTNRTDEGKLLLKVDTGLAGLTCSGLSDTSTQGTIVQGTVKYTDKPLPINCVQTVSNLNDYVQPATITLEYDYQEALMTTVTVKNSQG